MATIDTGTDIELFGRRIPVSPPGSPDPGDGDTDITTSTGFSQNEPAGTPDPGDGDTDIERSTGFSEHETNGPTVPTNADTTIEILLGLFNVSPPGPLPIMDLPETVILSGVNLFAPEDAQIPADIASDPGGVLFILPEEENPDGSMQLPAINQTEEVTLGDGILNRDSGGISPLPAVNESVEVDLAGRVLQLSPTGSAAEDEAEVEDLGPRIFKDSGGVFGPLAIDQTTTVSIMGRTINIGS